MQMQCKYKSQFFGCTYTETVNWDIQSLVQIHASRPAAHSMDRFIEPRLHQVESVPQPRVTQLARFIFLFVSFSWAIADGQSELL